MSYQPVAEVIVWCRKCILNGVEGESARLVDGQGVTTDTVGSSLPIGSMDEIVHAIRDKDSVEHELRCPTCFNTKDFDVNIVTVPFWRSLSDSH